MRIKVPTIPAILPLENPFPEKRDRWQGKPGLLAAYDDGATIWGLYRAGMMHVRVETESILRLLAEYKADFDRAGLAPEDLHGWPGTAPAMSYFAVLPSESNLHPCLWFFTEEQEDGIEGMLYLDLSKVLWEGGRVSEVALGAGPRDPHNNVTYVELNDAMIMSLVEECRARARKYQQK